MLTFSGPVRFSHQKRFIRTVILEDKEMNENKKKQLLFY